MDDPEKFINLLKHQSSIVDFAGIQASLEFLNEVGARAYLEIQELRKKNESLIAANQKMRTLLSGNTLQKIRLEGFRSGTESAASVARDFNGVTDHPYDLGDCILGKLNLIKKSKVRRKKHIARNA